MQAKMICKACGSIRIISFDQYANFSCQNCGSPASDIITPINSIILICQQCNHKIPLMTPMGIHCSHKKCNSQIFKIAPADTIKQPIAKAGDIKDGVKIVIPYYAGCDRVDYATQTWVKPETVFALTDKLVIPPGFGVCDQFFTAKNATSIGAEKTKPFMNTIIKRTMRLFPKAKFYGFFNSDIVLPSDTDIEGLLPSAGFEFVLHHRMEVANCDNGSIDKLGSKVAGADGFIASSAAMKKMVKNYPDLIVGAPYWDDGLCVWLWDNIGRDNVEMRYGEIWHFIHKLEWAPNDVDSQYNKDQLGDDINSKRLSITWKNVKTVEEGKAAAASGVGILQPGRIGDIIICLPIAKFYNDLGRQVYWPVLNQYLPMFRNIPYVTPLGIGDSFGPSRPNAVQALSEIGIENYVDLAIGFRGSPDELKWQESKLSFDQWKYKAANVPFQNKSCLEITRDLEMEEKLRGVLSDMGHKVIPGEYVVTHSNGSAAACKYNFQIDGVEAIEVQSIEGFTVFDWIGILTDAKAIYCVDSCIANLVEGLGLENPKFIKDWRDVYNPLDYLLRTPKLNGGWENYEECNRCIA